MNINTDVVPATVEEARTMLREGLDDSDREQMRITIRPTEFHYSVGHWLRENWSLWDPGSRLRKDFLNIGLHHPDDITAFLIEEVWCESRGETFDPLGFVTRTQAFWQQTVGNPIP